MAKTLPYRIYVKEEKADGSTFLIADEDPQVLAEHGEVVKVTVYHRANTVLLDGRVRVLPGDAKVTKE